MVVAVMVGDGGDGRIMVGPKQTKTKSNRIRTASKAVSQSRTCASALSARDLASLKSPRSATIRSAMRMCVSSSSFSSSATRALAGPDAVSLSLSTDFLSSSRSFTAFVATSRDACVCVSSIFCTWQPRGNAGKPNQSIAQGREPRVASGSIAQGVAPEKNLFIAQDSKPEARETERCFLSRGAQSEGKCVLARHMQQQ
jgi:hypothetical protein